MSLNSVTIEMTNITNKGEVQAGQQGIECL